jgi:hypothetical protein
MFFEKSIKAPFHCSSQLLCSIVKSKHDSFNTVTYVIRDRKLLFDAAPFTNVFGALFDSLFGTGSGFLFGITLDDISTDSAVSFFAPAIEKDL